MAKAKGLGRGLDVYFEDENKSVTGVRISSIVPNPTQPRRVFDDSALHELSESIRKNGIITPLALRKVGDTYQIIAGERRWRAARLAGLKEVPAIVLDVDDRQAYELALIENLQREDLNPIEEAEGFLRLMEEFSLTQEQAAEIVGRSRPAVSNSLRLLSLPGEVKGLVEGGQISAGHGRALLSLEDLKTALTIAKQVVEEGLSVRQTEQLCKRINTQKPDKKEKQSDIYIAQLERDMSSRTGHKVSIAHGAKKGRITIEYYGNEDLQSICDALEKMSK